jgi:ATP-dependent DNA helicase RecG
MEISQIKEIISLGESQEVEFKESFSHHKICKSLCALGNTLGGMIFMGVKDTGEIKGLDNLDEIQKKIASSNQCISPSPIISIEIHKIENKKIVVVIIQRATDNIYYTFEGVIYARKGSTNEKLDGQSHLEFLRTKQILSFDETYENDAKLEDLDIEKIQNYLISRNQKDFLETHKLEDFLLSKKLASKNGKSKLKNSAVLLFAKDPTMFYPQSEIKFVKFKGKEPVEILNHQLIQKDLFSSIEESIRLIKDSISKEIKITGNAKREERYEYPLEAIREAIVNAIAHRDYFSKDSIQIYVFENRIEITNPGSLPQGLTKELFGTISVQRNPITYRFLRDLEYVEGLGTGIPRMKNHLRKVGLKDPEFIFTESFFRIILYNKKSKKEPIRSKEDLNEKQRKALDYLKRNKTLKSKTYEEINKVSHATAVSEINEMIEFGYLEKIGAYRGVYYILGDKK